jgi:hypothetical protein
VVIKNGGASPRIRKEGGKSQKEKKRKKYAKKKSARAGQNENRFAKVKRKKETKTRKEERKRGQPTRGYPKGDFICTGMYVFFFLILKKT